MLQLSAVITPTDAQQGVKWTSSNSRTASVSAGGLVTAHRSGTVTITAAARDGSGKKATCKVRLTVLAKSIGISGTSDSASGGKAALKVLVLPDKTANKSVSWESTDLGIATVDKKDVVKAKSVSKPSQVTIRVRTRDGTNLSANYVITVHRRR